MQPLMNGKIGLGAPAETPHRMKHSPIVGIILTFAIGCWMFLCFVRQGLLLYDDGKDQGLGASLIVCAVLAFSIAFNAILGVILAKEAKAQCNVHRKRRWAAATRFNLGCVLAGLVGFGTPLVLLWNFVTWMILVPMLPIFRFPYPYALPRWIMMTAIGPFWIVGNGIFGLWVVSIVRTVHDIKSCLPVDKKDFEVVEEHVEYLDV